ncbi:MAG: hypothetical protein DSY41_00630, partial [Candidatus Poseidoniales archaeon]
MLAAQDCDLVICARRRTELEALAEELTTSHGTTVEVVTADLSGSAGVEELIRRAGDVDILVNNAGFGTSGNHIDLDVKGELAMVDLNVRTLTHLSHHYGKQMASKKSGRILNVASIAAFQPGPSMATYCATKSYVLSYSRALRHELEALHTRKAGAVVRAWKHLGSNDRHLRWAARVAIEHQPVGEWADEALAEEDPQASLTALCAIWGLWASCWT